jgi:hypothetical protein
MESIHLAQDRDQWRAPVSTVMNLRLAAFQKRLSSMESVIVIQIMCSSVSIVTKVGSRELSFNSRNAQVISLSSHLLNPTNLLTSNRVLSPELM